MSTRGGINRWDSKFGQFVQGYGVERLAKELGVGPSAVYHWIRGSVSPHPAKAISIQRLAKRAGTVLTLDEIYEHFREVRSKCYMASSLKPQHARA